ncbi:hypothetical protein FHR99_001864 [Litorivivens lipolytica]|uniref:TIGR01777 family protein n=1 Tax=Litorivivens lipolytica TaxID=1524264 RepID=A0A7W4Z5W0_9GAMM|nr:TIGR01777 family oxidoreductase [Litorivivens lipolytica]MBB3047598.1 hypothetical protein [Litorivivens lipolytica]
MTEIKRVLLTGGTGFVGSALTRALIDAGYQVTILTRQARSDLGDIRYINALPTTTEAWPFDAIINLAGENLFAKRWNPTQKQRLRDSRIQLTEQLAAGIKASPTIQRFISASAIGYYGASDAPALDENATAGDDFAAHLCRDWEACALQAEESTHVQRLRIGVVLGDGGALDNLLPPFKLGLGGPIGSGKQGFSWIHISDLVKLLMACLRGELNANVINAVAPQPVSNKTFSKALGRALHRPAVIPMPPRALRLMLGEVSALLTTGQFVVPKAALEEGFQFRFETIDSALNELLN